MKVNGFVYLACPYTTDDMQLRELRWKAITECTARLAWVGFTVYSPISLTYHVDKFMGFPDSEFWYRFDEPFIELADILFVLTLPGWQISVGVSHEISRARMHTERRQGIPVYPIPPYEYIKDWPEEYRI